MKKIFILGCFLFVRITISAQWLSNGTHIYNTNSGNVGIGTSSPANTLHIIGGLSAGDSKFYNSIQLTDAINGNTQSWIWTGATNQLSLGVGAVSSGNTKMLINSSGNVGIGTLYPQNTFEVAGSTGIRIGDPANTYSSNMVFGQPSAWNSGVRVYDNGNAEMRIWHKHANGNIYITTGYDGNESTVLPNDGLQVGNGNRVGIGINTNITSGAKLQLNGGASIGNGFIATDPGSGNLIVQGKMGAGTSSPQGLAFEAKYSNGGSSFSNSVATVTLGDDATLSDAVFSVKNAGNRGNIGNTNGSPLIKLAFSDVTALLVDKNGNMGIGTTSPSEKLSVNGNISTKKCIVTQIGWSDYVFNDDYKLRPLSEVAQYIKDNKRLPEVPSAKKVGEKGLSVGDNQALLLKKIEELTLYVLELKNENKEQSIKIKRLENQVRKNK